jgi:DNA-binding transcriptional LysR family regulator
MLHSRMLRYLDEVARAGSIRRAAERLNVASSAINRQILTLERELGTPIFQRLPRRLRLTAAGEVLISHVRQTLKEHERVQAQILDLKGLHGGAVTLVTMNGLASGLVPRIVAEFSHQHPRIKTTVRSLFAEQIVHTVSEVEADLGLAYNLPQDPRLQVIEAFETRLGAVVSPRHPLARRSPVRLSECAEFPLILADSSMTIHQIMTAAFARSNLIVEPTYLSNSIEFLKFLARAGEGVTFLSATDVAEEERAGELVYIPIADRSVHKQALALLHRRSQALDPAANLLAETIRGAVRDLVRQP